jgi:hypothetical protein
MSPKHVEALVKESWRNLAWRRFHWRHAVEARSIRRTIESRHGRTDPSQLKLADVYARDVFGDARYAPWLQAYTAFNGSFREGWIPDNYYGSVVVPKLKGLYGQISNLKPVSRLLFRDDAFPDIAYYVNGMFFTADHIAIPESAILDTVFSTSERVAFKLDQSSQGRGIYLIDRKDFRIGRIKALGNGVLQRFIVQHQWFDQFQSKAVATVRFTTVVDDAGHISLRACFLRLGRATDTHICPDSEVCIAVDLRTGRLCSKGYLNDWSDVDAHPDSHVTFAGLTLPSFPECLQKVIELHAKLPFARCVGWDVTVDSNGHVIVLEWNAEHNDVKFGEATQGPCFAGLGWEALGSLNRDSRTKLAFGR